MTTSPHSHSLTRQALMPLLRLAAPLAAVCGWIAEAALVEAQGWEVTPELWGILASIPAAIVALQQGSTLVDLLPRWVSLLLAGAALLAAGLRIEQLRTLGAAGRAAFTTLR